MFCKNCGLCLPEQARFCTRCGTRVAPLPCQPAAEQIAQESAENPVQTEDAAPGPIEE